MNKLFQFIITSPPIPEQYTIKCLTVSSPDKGTAVAHVISDLEKNKITNYGINMVGEFEAEAFIRSLSPPEERVEPIVVPEPPPVEYKVVEEKESGLTPEKSLEAMVKFIKSI